MGPLTANAKKYGYLIKDEEISFIIAGEISFMMAGEISFIIAGEISFIIAATMRLLFFVKYNHRYVLCCNSVFTVPYCLVSKMHFFPND
jgi:hypothetical protein